VRHITPADIARAKARLPKCATCDGRGFNFIASWSDVYEELETELCGDCGGTGFNTDIPAAVLFDEMPENVLDWLRNNT